MYCSNCGHKNQDDDRFCRQCGTPLKEPDTPNSAHNPSKSEFSTPSFLDQPTQLMDLNSSSSNQDSQIPHLTDTSDSKNTFNTSKEETKVKSLEDLNSISLASERPFINPNEVQFNWNSPTPKSSKKGKGKFIIIGLICLALGVIGGGSAYFFFNGKKLPFIGTITHSDTKESTQIKVAEEGEETSTLEISSESESGFRISIYSASSEEILNESATSKEASTSSQPIKVQTLDPWAGKYKTNYVMKVRKEPSYEGERITSKEKGEIFEVVKSEVSSKNSIWGQLPDGGWICLKDDDLVYATKIE